MLLLDWILFGWQGYLGLDNKQRFYFRDIFDHLIFADMFLPDFFVVALCIFKAAYAGENVAALPFIAVGSLCEVF